MKKNFPTEFVYQIFALLISFIIVHAVYVTLVRPAAITQEKSAQKTKPGADESDDEEGEEGSKDDEDEEEEEESEDEYDEDADEKATPNLKKRPAAIMQGKSAQKTMSVKYECCELNWSEEPCHSEAAQGQFVSAVKFTIRTLSSAPFKWRRLGEHAAYV